MEETATSSAELLGPGLAIVIIIIVCSIVALAVFLERMWALRRTNILPSRFEEQVRTQLAEEQWHEALVLCRGTNCASARLLEEALRLQGSPRRVVRERLEDIGRREALTLENLVGIVGVVGAITPLLGLLGTVWGMIHVFKVIQDVGVGNPTSLAGGISTALYTTFAGLTVAIPAVVGHRVLLNRVDKASQVLEEISLDALDLIAPPNPTSDEASTVEGDAS